MLDNLEVAKQLPDVVLAFFYMSEESRAVAVRMHSSFLQAYPEVDAWMCPLVRLDLAGGGDPFS